MNYELSIVNYFLALGGAISQADGLDVDPLSKAADTAPAQVGVTDVLCGTVLDGTHGGGQEDVALLGIDDFTRLGVQKHHHNPEILRILDELILLDIKGVGVRTIISPSSSVSRLRRISAVI